jgi:hypothetical protein
MLAPVRFSSAGDLMRRLVLCLILAGCGGGNTERHVIESDSAGVRIVLSTAAAWGDSARWRVSAEPILDIGKVEGASEYLFSDAHSPTRLSDGRIAVGDVGSSELRYYDAKGNFLMRRGRKGQGPGEWHQLYLMRRGGEDSIHVIAPVSQHSVISPAGEYVRRFALDPVPNRPNIWSIGRLSNGTMLAYSLAPAGDRVIVENARGEESTLGRDTTTRPAGFYREQYMHFLYDMEGHLIDSVGLLPGRMAHGSGAQAPFLAGGVYAVRDDTLYFGLGDADEIRVYAFSVDALAAGRPRVVVKPNEAGAPRASMALRRIIRRSLDSTRVVTPEITAAYKENRRAALTRAFRNAPEVNIELTLETTPIPDLIPAQARLLVDGTGHLWAQEYVLPGKGDDPTRWSVYERSGRWLGKLAMPSRFRISEIGPDYVLGIWRDPEDVQHVRMYALDRSP